MPNVRDWLTQAGSSVDEAGNSIMCLGHVSSCWNTGISWQERQEGARPHGASDHVPRCSR